MPARNTLPNPEPEWFKDINYDFIEDLDLNGWFNQLIARTRIDLETILHPDKSDSDLWNSYLETILALARSGLSADDEGYGLPGLYEIPQTYSVAPEDTDSHTKHLHVNLHAPDKVIREQFAAWLKITRKIIPSPSKVRGINEDDLYRWRTRKILQLHDLVTYKRLTNQIKSNSDIIPWLYGEYSGEQSDVSYINERLKTLNSAKDQIITIAFQRNRGEILAKNTPQ